jgi:SAM-dependent methyltransferase
MRRKAKINQMVIDNLRKPINETRILDLASLEGDFSAEMAIRGARVVSIEGRASNIEIAKQKFNYPNIEYIQDDVRNLSVEKYGRFDVVLCLGILYHLDTPDCFALLDAISSVCDGFAIIDTHISWRGTSPATHNGRNYIGWQYTEYQQAPSKEIEESSRWASIGNTKSFWPTKPSLINALVDSGFSSVYECQYPAWNDIPADRVALVALKGGRETNMTGGDNSFLWERMDEHPSVGPIHLR